MKYIIGVDVGGTNVKLGMVSPSGRVVARSHLNTKSFTRSRTHLIQAIVGTIEQLIADFKISKRDISGVGFGLPGQIDPTKGIVKFLPNISGWKNVPLRQIIQNKLKLPVFLGNDAHLITLAEWKFGAGRGVQNLICITLGTGVGGGLILNNALYRGEGFVAGEIGHVPLNEHGPACNCGGFGCFERFVGNQVLFAKAGKIFHLPEMTTEEMFRLAGRGNRKALRFWDETATHIGNGLVGAINLLNPRLIILGGGVANNFKFLHKKIKQVIDQRAMKVQAAMVKIVQSQLGDDAGIIGAQVLVKEFLSEK